MTAKHTRGYSLSKDGLWVIGPATSTDNAVTRYDGTSGALIQDQSGVYIDDTGQLGAGGVSAPAAKLHVGAGASSGTTVYIDGSTTDNIPLDVDSANSLTKFRVKNSSATAANTDKTRFSLDANTTTSLRSMLEFFGQWSDNTDATRTARAGFKIAAGGSFDYAMGFVGHDMLVGDTSAADPGARLHVRQDTDGVEAMRVETYEASGTNVQERVFQFKGTTTNAAITTVGTITNTMLGLSANGAVGIVATCVGRRTGGTGGSVGDSGVYHYRRGYKLVSSTMSGIAAASVDAWEDQAAWDFVISGSGTDLLVRVTGAANNNVSWVVTVRAYPLFS